VTKRVHGPKQVANDWRKLLSHSAVVSLVSDNDTETVRLK